MKSKIIDYQLVDSYNMDDNASREDVLSLIATAYSLLEHMEEKQPGRFKNRESSIVKTKLEEAFLFARCI